MYIFTIYIFLYKCLSGNCQDYLSSSVTYAALSHVEAVFGQKNKIFVMLAFLS